MADQDDNLEDGENPKKGGGLISKKSLILLGGVFLLATIGGFFAGQMHKSGNEYAGLSPEEIAAKKKEEEEARIAKIKETELMQRSIYYVDIGQMVVPVVEEGVTSAFLLAEIKLEVYEPDSVGKLNQMIPRLRDNITQYLYGQVRRGTFADANIDIKMTAGGIQASLNTMLDREAISRVVFDKLLLQQNPNALQAAPSASAAITSFTN